VHQFPTEKDQPEKQQGKRINGIRVPDDEAIIHTGNDKHQHQAGNDPVKLLHIGRNPTETRHVSGYAVEIQESRERYQQYRAY
jgi:hypothetical protein